MSIKCTWNKIATRTSGRPIVDADVSKYQIEMRVEGAPSFSVIDDIPSAVLEYTIDVSDPGLYEFRVRGFDSTGAPGAYATGQLVIPDQSPLSAPGNFTVQLV